MGCMLSWALLKKILILQKIHLCPFRNTSRNLIFMTKGIPIAYIDFPLSIPGNF